MAKDDFITRATPIARKLTFLNTQYLILKILCVGVFLYSFWLVAQGNFSAELLGPVISFYVASLILFDMLSSDRAYLEHTLAIIALECSLEENREEYLKKIVKK